MRVLVLHSDVAPDAPADEQDTLITARAIAEALESRGHRVSLAPFVFDPEALRALIAKHRADAVFNMVEAIFGQGELAPVVPTLLEKLNVPFTGCRAAPMALAPNDCSQPRICPATGEGCLPRVVPGRPSHAGPLVLTITATRIGASDVTRSFVRTRTCRDARARRGLYRMGHRDPRTSPARRRRRDHRDHLRQ